MSDTTLLDQWLEEHKARLVWAWEKGGKFFYLYHIKGRPVLVTYMQTAYEVWIPASLSNAWEETLKALDAYLEFS